MTLKFINRTSAFICVHNLFLSVDARPYENTMLKAGYVVLLQVKCPITGTFSYFSYVVEKSKNSNFL